MRNKFLSKLICLFLSIVTLVLSFSGCSDSDKPDVSIEAMDLEEVYTFSFDCIGGKDVMPIAGYYGPQANNGAINGQRYPNHFTDAIMSAISECGVNIITANGANYESYPEYTKQLLDLGEKFGIGIFVRDGAVMNNVKDKALSVEELDERISSYRSHPAFAGVYVVDEPGTLNFRMEGDERFIENYAPIFQNLKKLNTAAYGNLLPLGRAADIDAYQKYIDEYLNTCPVDFLSYDKYPFVDEDSPKDPAVYLKNLSMIRSAAESKHIPFWGFVQAGAQWNDGMNYFDSKGYFPTEGPFSWIVNTTLAFGAKGIQYFPLIQPTHFAYALSTPYDFERNGVIGAWGNKNRWWYYAKKLNKHISEIDEILMNSVSKGLIISSDDMYEEFKSVDCLFKGKSWRELKNVSGETLVGCFNYFGKSAFYVVNYNTEFSQKITLDFAGKYNLRVIQNAKEEFLNSDSLQLEMTPGEGVLVVVV